MDATGVSHIAICVQDVEKSLAFYRDILGLRVTLDQVQDTTTGGLPHVYHQARKTRRTVHLRYGEGNTLPFLVVTGHPNEGSDGHPISWTRSASATGHLPSGTSRPWLRT
jgi:catechol 2,3-dioxygenase-like lactoylglutathione lyase family enzyme